MPEFKSWERDNLNKFAYDAYLRLVEQEDLIQQLQNDLKDAIEAYRVLIRKAESPTYQ
jgi:hypothetical protein